MGYSDSRVIDKIKNSDRCNLCKQLCSIDFFLETKCFHLFCVDCFKNYLKENGHNDDIRDETNYIKLYHPVKCPVGNNIIQYKHIKGSTYAKIKKFFDLSQYRIRCKFYKFGCNQVCKPTKLRSHYMECFFTSQRISVQRPPDFYTNNLYEEFKFELLNGIKFNNDGDIQKEKIIKKNNILELDNLIELDDECSRYESIDDKFLSNLNSNDLKNNNTDYTIDLNKNNLLIDLNDSNSISTILMIENSKLKNSSINLLIDEKNDNNLNKLKQQLNNLQKNMNFIKEQLVHQFERTN